jgi:hypothetical protein
LVSGDLESGQRSSDSRALALPEREAVAPIYVMPVMGRGPALSDTGVARGPIRKRVPEEGGITERSVGASTDSTPTHIPGRAIREAGQTRLRSRPQRMHLSAPSHFPLWQCLPLSGQCCRSRAPGSGPHRPHNSHARSAPICRRSSHPRVPPYPILDAPAASPAVLAFARAPHSIGNSAPATPVQFAAASGFANSHSGLSRTH